ncbi:MAG: response regulator [Spirochaetaceae bacterium]|nr:response regulator [Spirochaetaceae bacterium]
MDESGKIKILFIDDENLICTMAGDVLEFFGFNVETFKDSSQALECFKSNPRQYDIIVTDQKMPGMTGYEMLSRISEIRDDIPKILCTGYSEEVDDFKNSLIGIDAFFLKPYHFEDLIEQINKLV